MEATKKPISDKERDILHSQTIKAGQRIYYVDVKRNRRDEMYLCVTESKKLTTGDPEMPQTTYEKHKIFIYQEDFQKFLTSFQNAIQFIQEQQGTVQPRPQDEEEGEIKIDMEF